jgi:hypothetical protein
VEHLLGERAYALLGSHAVGYEDRELPARPRHGERGTCGFEGAEELRPAARLYPGDARLDPPRSR